MLTKILIPIAVIKKKENNQYFPVYWWFGIEDMVERAVLSWEDEAEGEGNHTRTYIYYFIFFTGYAAFSFLRKKGQGEKCDFF